MNTQNNQPFRFPLERIQPILAILPIQYFFFIFLNFFLIDNTVTDAVVYECVGTLSVVSAVLQFLILQNISKNAPTAMLKQSTTLSLLFFIESIVTSSLFIILGMSEVNYFLSAKETFIVISITLISQLLLFLFTWWRRPIVLTGVAYSFPAYVAGEPITEQNQKTNYVAPNQEAAEIAKSDL